MRSNAQAFRRELDSRIEEDFWTALFFDYENVWLPAFRAQLRRQRIYLQLSRDRVVNSEMSEGAMHLQMEEASDLKDILLDQRRVQAIEACTGTFESVWNPSFPRNYGYPDGGQVGDECGWLAINFLRKG